MVKGLCHCPILAKRDSLKILLFYNHHFAIQYCTICLNTLFYSAFKVREVQRGSFKAVSAEHFYLSLVKMELDPLTIVLVFYQKSFVFVKMADFGKRVTFCKVGSDREKKLEKCILDSLRRVKTLLADFLEVRNRVKIIQGIRVKNLKNFFVLQTNFEILQNDFCNPLKICCRYFFQNFGEYYYPCFYVLS